MKKSFLLALTFVAVSISGAYGQQLDAAFGVGTLIAPSASSANSDHAPQTMGGGTFLSFSGDFLFYKHLGISGEGAWRASQNLYGGFQPFRPVLYDFNAIYAPSFHNVGAELMAGIGGSSSRFYTPYYNCSFTGCTDYTSSNHFMTHFGAAVRWYPVGNFFIRPEAHLYLINNNFEFSSARATRVGISIGYSFKPGF